MKWTVDTEAGLISRDGDGGLQTTPLYSTAGFEELSKLWLKVGWNQKYVYTFSWMGRPIIQLPEDVLRIQEVIHAQQPDVIIETGVDANDLAEDEVRRPDRPGGRDKHPRPGADGDGRDRREGRNRGEGDHCER